MDRVGTRDQKYRKIGFEGNFQKAISKGATFGHPIGGVGGGDEYWGERQIANRH